MGRGWSRFDVWGSPSASKIARSCSLELDVGRLMNPDDTRFPCRSKWMARLTRVDSTLSNVSQEEIGRHAALVGDGFAFLDGLSDSGVLVCFVPIRFSLNTRFRQREAEWRRFIFDKVREKLMIAPFGRVSLRNMVFGGPVESHCDSRRVRPRFAGAINFDEGKPKWQQRRRRRQRRRRASPPS